MSTWCAATTDSAVVLSFDINQQEDHSMRKFALVMAPVAALALAVAGSAHAQGPGMGSAGGTVGIGTGTSASTNMPGTGVTSTTNSTTSGNATIGDTSAGTSGTTTSTGAGTGADTSTRAGVNIGTASSKEYAARTEDGEGEISHRPRPRGPYPRLSREGVVRLNPAGIPPPAGNRARSMGILSWIG
jgi:hypothetical protein